MKLYPSKLSQYLATQPVPSVVMIFGDEPLQQIEALDAVRHKLLAAGAEERISLSAAQHFDWHEVVEHFQTLSLFSSKKIIEVFLPTAKVDKAGQSVLKNLADIENDDVSLILYGPRLGPDQQKLQWFKKLEPKAWFIQCYPLEPNRLPQWIHERCNQHGLSMDPDAVALLAEYCEGNLLAAKQEIEKLSLLYPQQSINYTQISQNIISQSRFNVFQLVDAVLVGDADRAIKIMLGILEEGTDATVILWALQREWQSLKSIKLGQEQGDNLSQLFKTHRIWSNRQDLIKRGLQRTTLDSINTTLKYLSEIDCKIKSDADVSAAHQFSHVIIDMISPGTMRAFSSQEQQFV